LFSSIIEEPSILIYGCSLLLKLPPLTFFTLLDYRPLISTSSSSSFSNSSLISSYKFINQCGSYIMIILVNFIENVLFNQPLIDLGDI